MKTPIIGKTKSGKPIFNKVRHSNHALFTDKEHREASNLHWAIYDKAMKMLEKKREGEPGFKPSQEAFNFIQNHHKMMAEHVRRANDLDTKVIVSSMSFKDRKELVNRINLLQREGKGIEAKKLFSLLENYAG